jgi:hypothetical protein
MACSADMFNNINEVIDIVRSFSLFEELGAHLDALLPTIEARIVMQGDSATLADGMYCFGRKFQSLESTGKVTVFVKLKKRFFNHTKQLFITFLLSHPMYAKVGRAKLGAGVVNVMKLTDCINANGDLRGHGKDSSAVSTALAIQEWSSSFDS